MNGKVFKLPKLKAFQKKILNLNQTTIFGLVQIESISLQQDTSNLKKRKNLKKKNVGKEKKALLEKDKILVTGNLFFSHNVFKR